MVYWLGSEVRVGEVVIWTWVPILLLHVLWGSLVNAAVSRRRFPEIRLRLRIPWKNYRSCYSSVSDVTIVKLRNRKHGTFYSMCELEVNLPVHVGGELHSPLAKQDTVTVPDRVYPLLQV